MAAISHSLLLVLTFLVAVSTLFEVSTAVLGLRDPKDPKVVEVAEYAIDEHNKEAKINLKLDHVLKAALQETTYSLVIASRDGTTLDNYDVVVLVNGDSKKLATFKKTNSRDGA
ncbi:cysteine proteinase inhibitor 1-like [Forsythia ovata]|uniref:Cysteine proteinase inhibitor 1-like n=1 Tax=Forsythia ovata TaxID=205694 RepID=A0ABD1S494_9LAMI